MTQENAGADAVLGAAAGLAGGAVAGAVATFKAASSFMDRLTSAPSTQKFEVNKDNILKAGKIIQDQASVLSRALEHATEDLKIKADARAEGKVGADIAAAWNSRLVGGKDTYAGRVDSYVASLDALATQLREAAKQYGFTEEEITTTFGKQK
ncbi:hypothetical protein [Lentzea nigeriaca]|uniref:hypothetical protein n=1 Tax=Lentzea nigeriaca TaxID=1128665 RepID=UPI00195CA39A|nr:hypothetical protein [Lentzea nigeriaca]MBM7861409.1 hypothetical protein [Lentzea nigeriaca]